MDPFTQGALGAALPQACCRQAAKVRIAGAMGFLAGMAADLDVLIRSSADPLLFLEYHRQFTHSLVFVPVGGFLAALALHFVAGRRWQLPFRTSALVCTLGYATHAVLDAMTSYGTRLLWPFSDERFAWKIISIIDPLFTLPLAALVALSALRRKPFLARLALLWAGLYLALGALQHQAALNMGRELAASRGHMPVRMEVKPSFGNTLVWKVLYQADGRYHVDAVRAGLRPRVYPGTSVPRFDAARDLPWLKPGTQQARDLDRFRQFSDGFLALDQNHPNRVIDVRYSLFPNEIDALWSIELSETVGPADHVRFLTHRRNARRRLGDLWNMIAGTE
ncbi:MAG: metal-dependent hydrolase [Pseudomonadota bacterium]